MGYPFWDIPPIYLVLSLNYESVKELRAESQSNTGNESDRKMRNALLGTSIDCPRWSLAGGDASLVYSEGNSMVEDTSPPEFDMPLNVSSRLVNASNDIA